MAQKEIELPDYLKNVAYDSSADMISSGGSTPRISLKGRQFRFIIEGEEKEKTSEPVDLVILGVVPESGHAHTFYINGYQPGVTDPPDCSSFLGIQPDSWVSSPQAKNCRDCPHQVWGSATSMSGKKAKACKDSKRLMVIRAQDLGKDDEPTVFILNVTVASLKALTQFGKFLLANRLPMAAVITRAEFVDSDFPQIEFNFVAVLNEDNGKKCIEAATEKPWMDGIKDSAKQLSAPEEVRQINSTTVTQDQPVYDGPPPSDDDILNAW